MFNKKNFGDKNYKMKKQYMADDLVVAKLARISNTKDDCGPIYEITEQKYTFEKIDNGEEIKYREIFTGFIAKDKGTYFNLPYVIDPEAFTDYFPETRGAAIPKLSLIWVQNDINHQKGEQVKRRVKTVNDNDQK